MEAKPQLQQSTQDEQIRAALDQHWAASDANDFETEHRIYLEDAVLEYPRAIQPNKKRFSIRRIIGSGELDYFRVWTCASNSTTIPLDCGLHSRL